MAGISLDFASDVSSFLRGTSDVEDALGEVADALDDLEDESSDAARRVRDDLESIAKEADTTADKSGDDLEQIGKDADDAADKAKRSFKDAFDDIRDRSRKASNDVDDDFDKAGEGAEDFKEEAASSGREAAASFSGEFDDITDLVQETAANAFAGFGPIGAAAGIAAAIGVGYITSELEKSKEKAEELKELARTLGESLRETGRIELADQLEDWIYDNADALDDLQTEAGNLGLTMDDMWAAYLGDPTALDRLNTAMSDGAAEARENWSSGSGVLDSFNQSLQDNATAAEMARDAEGAYADALGESAAAVEYAQEATETYNGSVQDALAEAGDAWQEYTDNGKVNLEQYAQAMEDQIAAVEDYQTNMVTASQTLTDEALSYLQNMGIEAAPLLEAFVNAPKAEQERIAGIWDQLGTTAVDGFSSGAAGLTGAAADAANTASDQAPPVTFRPDLDDSDLQWQADNAAARLRPPIVTMRGRIGLEAV